MDAIWIGRQGRDIVTNNNPNTLHELFKLKGRLIKSKIRNKKMMRKKNKEKIDLDFIFKTCGFDKIESEGKTITVNGQEGEIDRIYIFKNIIVLLEETATQKLAEHFIKKKHIHEIITSKKNRKECFEELSKKIPEFETKISEKKEFSFNDYKIISVYYSEKKELSKSIVKNKNKFLIMSYSDADYFYTLCKNIERSAKYEFLSFLNVSENEINPIHLNGGLSNVIRFESLSISKSIIRSDDEITLLSFYIPPNTLLKQSYVLRKGGWRSDPQSYQRLLVKEKITDMRKYIFDDKGTYLNNIIITLPRSTVITCPNKNTTIDQSTLTHLKRVIINIPEELGNIGIIDGQHRIYSYFQEMDSCKEKEAIRNKPSLLATAILFPKDITEEDIKLKEADIFWRINSTQTKVDDNLKQALESLLNPLSDISISKSILDKLINDTDLSNYVQSGFYLESQKIKTSSLIRYAITPATKPTIGKSRGKKTLFDQWREKSGFNDDELTIQNRNEYISFCAKVLQNCLAGAKANIGINWKVRSKLTPNGILSPTILGGFFLYLQNLVEEGKNLERIDYRKTFQTINTIKFHQYTSSKWAQYAKELFVSCPPVDL